MTVAFETYRPADPVLLLTQVAAQREDGGSDWWARLSEALDGLRAHLTGSDIAEIADQVVADAPELAASARRLPRMRQALRAEAIRLRLRVDGPGRRDPTWARARAAELVRRVRRLERNADDLLHDAYQRDFGGEQ